MYLYFMYRTGHLKIMNEPEWVYVLIGFEKVLTDVE